MALEVSTIIKFGFWTAFVLSTEHLYAWYIRQWKSTSARRIHEVFFIGNSNSSCCSDTASNKQLKSCTNFNCKAKLSRRIIEQINSAKQIICLAMHMLTVKHYAAAILNARKRGVTVRIIVCKSKLSDSSLKMLQELKNAGVVVRNAGDGEKLMHHTFCLIDVVSGGKTSNQNIHSHNGLLINGSMNWTSNGLDRNWENVIFTSDEHLTSEFKNEFDQMWVKLKPKFPY